MSFTKTCSAILLALGLFTVVAAPSNAGTISWDIDPAQSFVRLAIPDQSLSLDGTNATVRVRNSQNDSAWSDAGGRMARLDGTIEGTLTPGSSIGFSGGTNNINAVDSTTNFRPNPAAFDPNATNADNPDGTYTNTSGAPADFAARIRASVSILTLTIGQIAFRDVMFDLNSAGLALDGGGNFGGGSDFGIESALLDVDGLSVAIVGQVIPDVYQSPINNVSGTNTSGGIVTPLGGNLYQLLYNITVPINLDIDGTILTASASGQIVATGILVPEPSTLVLGAFAAFGLAFAGRRRFRRS